VHHLQFADAHHRKRIGSILVSSKQQQQHLEKPVLASEFRSCSASLN
jgi:hypothetical protein